MDRIVAFAIAGSLLLSSTSASAAQSANFTGAQAALAADIPSNGVGKLPAVPAGSSTIFGGSIQKVDPVLDQIQLKVYGERAMKILFDQRTQVFRDGVRIPLRDLKPTDHASVQTTLDGEKIFAISIHILSKLPDGQYRGRVLSFDRETGDLKLDAAPSPEPMRIHVPASVQISRTGQATFKAEGNGLSDLRPGSLVDVTFGGEGGKQAVASRIDVLAVPGSSFVFSGSVTALDIGNGFLTVADPIDNNSYRIAFQPAILPNSQALQIGQRVRITASFDGGNYSASSITPY